MVKKLLKGLPFLIVGIIQSCKPTVIPKPISIVIEHSSNQTELEKAINSYSKNPADSLKLKAAYFLIAHMDGWGYYQGEQLDHYQEYLKLIRRDKDHGEYFLHSFNLLYGLFEYNNQRRYTDINSIKAEELINNINMAFKVWHEQPWNKNIGFNDFCQYILPFRIKDEIPEYNRKAIYDQFNPLLDSIRKINGDAVAAGKVINDALSQPKWLFTERMSFLPHFKSSQIIAYHAGSCREMTDLAFYVMRAVGIPVAIDFVQQWPYRNSGHEFNVVLDSHKKMIAFLGAEDSPGTPHKSLTKKGKVYRHIYENNPESLANFIETGDEVPVFLTDKKIKDVTEEYAPVHRVTVTLYDNRSLMAPKKFVYLTVFDNNNWVAVDGAVNRNDKVAFKKVEGNIVYMAGYYHHKKVIAASDPFILDKNGGQIMLIPTLKKLQNMTLSRVFPVTVDKYNTWNIKGCHFQGSNKPDFSDACDLYIIPHKPEPSWNTVSINIKQTFRYFRFWSPRNTNIAEIELYSNGKKLRGNPIGINTGWHQEKSINLVFDGNVFTYFDSSGAKDPTWAGLDVGVAHKLDSIKYSPPVTEDSTAKVLNLHQYELFYWQKGNWVSAGTKSASGQQIFFPSIPANGLYLLKDRSEEVPERIFTYSNDKQTWW